MTSFAFIIGLSPLVFSTGIGARGNNAIGTGAVGGLLIGTIFGVFIIPILYIFFQWLQDKMNKVPDVIQDDVQPLNEGIMKIAKGHFIIFTALSLQSCL